MIADPRIFGDDIAGWADSLVLPLEYKFGQSPQWISGGSWQEWAYDLYSVIPELGQEGPNPESFVTWQEWAENLMNTQKIWSA